jgi:hypothetical protein
MKGTVDPSLSNFNTALRCHSLIPESDCMAGEFSTTHPDLRGTYSGTLHRLAQLSTLFVTEQFVVPELDFAKIKPAKFR